MWDMPIREAASEMLPVTSMSSRRSAFPGPSATSPLTESWKPRPKRGADFVPDFMNVRTGQFRNYRDFAKPRFTRPPACEDLRPGLRRREGLVEHLDEGTCISLSMATVSGSAVRSFRRRERGFGIIFPSNWTPLA